MWDYIQYCEWCFIEILDSDIFLLLALILLLLIIVLPVNLPEFRLQSQSSPWWVAAEISVQVF